MTDTLPGAVDVSGIDRDKSPLIHADYDSVRIADAVRRSPHFTAAYANPGDYDDAPEPQDSAVELRTDAAILAERLVAHDRAHGGGTTSRPPQPRTDGNRDAERDSARAYLRREWIAAREAHLL
ncbi:hypothetical protein ACFVP0_33625 [Streptomyces cinereoruber]|uniref:hypothetical protein n=1 Tax=Streptomyces cinereoruber TaxID=67260 RepID=UPI0036D1E5A5